MSDRGLLVTPVSINVKEKSCSRGFPFKREILVRHEILIKNSFKDISDAVYRALLKCGLTVF